MPFPAGCGIYSCENLMYALSSFDAGMVFDDELCSRTIVTRPGIGTAAESVQEKELRHTRVLVEQPSLALVRQGTMILQLDGEKWVVEEGQAVAIASTASYDITYCPSRTGVYIERWLHWEPLFVESFLEKTEERDGEALRSAAPLGCLDDLFLPSFTRAFETLQAPSDSIPAGVVKHRMYEILAWLSHYGLRFAPETKKYASLDSKIRRMLLPAPDRNWNESEVAGCLGMSPATLRRHLADEATSFREILTDVRMSFARKLLQSTNHSVGSIALQVGYESASRFAIRFRKWFGVSPSSVRGSY